MTAAAWVLVLWINGVNGTSSIDHINFPSQEACETARDAVLHADHKGSNIERADHPMLAVCVAGSEE